MALSGQTNCAGVCPLLGNSGHWWASELNGLAVNDPKRTLLEEPQLWCHPTDEQRADDDDQDHDCPCIK